MNFVFVKSRSGETVTDDKLRTVTEAGAKVPLNQFWLRRLDNGEVLRITEEKAEEKVELKRFGKKID